MVQETNPNQPEVKEDGKTDNPTQALVRRVPHSYSDHYTREGLSVSEEHTEQQHQEYVRALEAAALRVSFVEADEDMPDCVFIEDTAIVLKRHAIMTHMHQKREMEHAAVEAVLRKTHTVCRLGGEARLEGGDVLHIGDTTYVGLSSRTNELGANILREFLSQFGRRVVKIPVDNCLHLKSGLTYLGNGTLIAISGWFDQHQFDIDDVIYTKSGEHGCANCLRIRDHLLIPDGYPQTKPLLNRFAEKHAVHIRSLDISEFEKGDGSLTCLSLIW
jgi:dimethylargininase